MQSAVTVRAKKHAIYELWQLHVMKQEVEALLQLTTACVVPAAMLCKVQK